MVANNISELIANAGDRLTQTDRRIAEAVLAEPTLLAFGTVSDLATRVEISRPSVVRFANKLGFEGYTELQEHIRRLLSHQLARPTERIRRDEPTSNAHTVLDSALASAFEAAQGERLARLADPLVEAPHVWIISGETSQAGAHVLASGLSMLRPHIDLIGDHFLGRDLGRVAAEDVVVVFGFYRYRRAAVIAARVLAERGITIVAITDGALSPLASLTERWCELRVPAIGPFDSSVPAVAMAELMVAHVARRLQAKAMERVDRIEEMWAQTDTYFLEG